ncbi:MAG: hypothetical protein PHG82_04390 [Candidatus Gracilibacteria bacterium]|nr:hypothetical protein [Candidatus Gracilibacteria bacterium]
MEAFMLFMILAINVLISVWNTYAVGTAWKDTMAFGTKFDKALLWSGIIQSGVGFSMPILIALAYGSVAYFTSGEKPELSPEDGKQMMQWIFSLWYIAVIFPILGSGLAIWAHSLRIAFKNRDFASIATAGWNTFAQIHNTISAVNNLGGAFKSVGGLFDSLGSSKSDSKGNAAVLAIILVIFALTAGFTIAFSLVRYFANKTHSRIEEYAKTKQYT